MSRFKTKAEIFEDSRTYILAALNLDMAFQAAKDLLDTLSPLRATNVAAIRYKVDFCELYALVMNEVERPSKQEHEEFQDFLEIKDPYAYKREDFTPISRRTKW